MFLYSLPFLLAPYFSKVLLYPTRDIPDQSKMIQQIEQMTGAEKSDVKIEVPNGNTIDGWFFKSPASKKVFLVSHGNAGNISNRILTALMLIKSGGSVLLYDYEGYGRSTGEPSVETIQTDGQLAYDYLSKKLHYEPDDIVDYGESIGASVAVSIARHNKVSELIIQSGFTSLPDVIRDKLFFMWLYPPAVFHSVDMDNITYLRGPHPPLLLIHGDKDATLPLKYAQTNFALASNPTRLVVVSGAGHDDVSFRDPRLFVTSIVDFMKTVDGNRHN